MADDRLRWSDLDPGAYVLVYDTDDTDLQWSMVQRPHNRSKHDDEGLKMISWEGRVRNHPDKSYGWDSIEAFRYFIVPPEQADAITMAARHMNHAQWNKYAARVSAKYQKRSGILTVLNEGE